ncbi:hypothetical protein [Mycobacterium sp. pW045]
MQHAAAHRWVGVLPRCGLRVGQAQLEPTEASVLAMLLPAVCTF